MARVSLTRATAAGLATATGPPAGESVLVPRIWGVLREGEPVTAVCLLLSAYCCLLTALEQGMD